jgi:outer membrane protein OmpA-like peptidoglycan-associated protein
MRQLIKNILFVLFLALPLLGAGQLVIDTSLTSRELVNDVLLGKRVQVRNVVYAGSKLAIAHFSDTSATPLISDGILLTTGKVFDAQGPNKRANTSYNIGTRGDHSLEGIAKGMTFDAAYLEFDFKPEMEYVAFNFVFGSEEYTEYVNTQFNDVFAFFIRGPGINGIRNLAVIQSTKSPITVNTVNHLSNRSNYIDNNHFDRYSKPKESKKANLYPDLLNIYEYDGFTTLLTAECKVIPGEVYHIKISIADVSDSRYDSGVFLEAKSFTSLPEDPGARAAILEEEYKDVKRKFQPTRVGEPPRETVFIKDTVATPTVPTASTLGKGWAFRVNFEFDEATLAASEKARLDSLWKYVLAKSPKKVMVQGHTDNVGGEGYNDRLAAKRAAAVLAYLRSKGLPEKRISTQSFGFHKPATTNETEEGRALNRRVEVRLE